MPALLTCWLAYFGSVPTLPGLAPRPGIAARFIAPSVSSDRADAWLPDLLRNPQDPGGRADLQLAVGRRGSALDGAPVIKALRAQASGAIEVMACGGVRAANALRVIDANNACRWGGPRW